MIYGPRDGMFNHEKTSEKKKRFELAKKMLEFAAANKVSSAYF